MFGYAGGLSFDLHAVTGMIAILLMFIHAAWALVTLLRNEANALQNFHKFSVVVWAIWLVPYFSPMVIAIGS